MREGVVKKRTTVLLLVCRTGILSVLLLLVYLGGFVKEEFEKLLYLILPMTFLYLALVVKFITNNRYLARGKNVAPVNSYQGVILPGIIYLFEFIFIAAKGLFNWISIEAVYVAVLIIECGLGVYAGMYLAVLYAPKDAD